MRVAILLSCLLMWGSVAEAFRIGAHEKITQRAIDLEAKRFPILARYAKVIVKANGWEDKNLLVKWLKYNHFYKPTTKIRTLYRKTSDVRVKDLWRAVVAAVQQRKIKRAFDRIGHLVHHIQDMASPPHVIPVNHGLFDRFEKYRIDDIVARARGKRLPDLSGPKAHHECALDTYRAVQNGGIRAGGRRIPWASFWKERGSRFGSYGSVGNAFGKTTLELGTAELEAAPASYERFMKARIAAAVGYTRSFLRWAVGRIRALQRGKSR